MYILKNAMTGDNYGIASRSVYVCWDINLTGQCLDVNWTSKSDLHTGPRISRGQFGK